MGWIDGSDRWLPRYFLYVCYNFLWTTVWNEVATLEQFQHHQVYESDESLDYEY